MRLNIALQEKLMDVRLRDKLVTDGKITKAEVEEFLKSLPDDQTRASVTGGEDREANLSQ